MPEVRGCRTPERCPPNTQPATMEGTWLRAALPKTAGPSGHILPLDRILIDADSSTGWPSPNPGTNRTEGHPRSPSDRTKRPPHPDIRRAHHDWYLTPKFHFGKVRNYVLTGWRPVRLANYDVFCPAVWGGTTPCPPGCGQLRTAAPQPTKPGEHFPCPRIRHPSHKLPQRSPLPT